MTQLGTSPLTVDGKNIAVEGDFGGGAPRSSHAAELVQVGVIRRTIAGYGRPLWGHGSTLFSGPSVDKASAALEPTDAVLTLRFTPQPSDQALSDIDAIEVVRARPHDDDSTIRFGLHHGIRPGPDGDPVVVVASESFDPGRSFRFAVVKQPYGFWQVLDLQAQDFVRVPSIESLIGAAVGSNAYALLQPTSHPHSHPGPATTDLIVRTDAGGFTLVVDEVTIYAPVPMAFSEDDTVLFRAYPDGSIASICTATGATLARIVGHKPARGIRCFGGLLWTVDEDWAVTAYGVAGAANAVPRHEPPRLPERLPAHEPPWVPQPPRLPENRRTVGGRVLRSAMVDGVASIIEEPSTVMTSVKAQPGDDAKLLARFKKEHKRWAAERDELFQRFSRQNLHDLLAKLRRTGGSVPGEELRADFGQPWGAGYEGTAWRSLDGTLLGVFVEASRHLSDIDGNPITLEGPRWRLVHPAQYADGPPPWLGPIGTMYRPAYSSGRAMDGAEVFPIDTDNGRTPPSMAVHLLRMAGFVSNPFVDGEAMALDLRAPELGAIARATIDTEHGGCRLTFHRFTGTAKGGETLPINAVDSQLLSEAIAATVAAHPDDPAAVAPA